MEQSLFQYFREILRQAFFLTFSHMGTTALAVGIALSLYLIKNRSAVLKKIFWQDVEASAIVLVVFWIGLFLYCVVEASYNKEEPTVRYVSTLQGQVSKLQGDNQSLQGTNSKLVDPKSLQDQVKKLQGELAKFTDQNCKYYVAYGGVTHPLDERKPVQGIYVIITCNYRLNPPWSFQLTFDKSRIFNGILECGGCGTSPVMDSGNRHIVGSAVAPIPVNSYFVVAFDTKDPYPHLLSVEKTRKE